MHECPYCHMIITNEGFIVEYNGKLYHYECYKKVFDMMRVKRAYGEDRTW
jgi:YHS domain-containing protein